eukprot:TRINITY_DN2806_c0_g1_i1.p1 TRINITY_DN2806_c0_g1~~TRINITY_DN2806_c0_g1_i1.p1  ORF type:complete len:227 (+),score=41.85 TRINITY_DN2806_c0_g1_i1:72-683(+)
MQHQEYNIILPLGDTNSGKTTFLSTLLNHTFPQIVTHIIPPTIITNQIDGETIYTEIIDTSSREIHEGIVNDDMKAADVILLFYDCTSEKALKRVVSDWLPRICEMGVYVPVCLIGNKVDLKDGEVGCEGEVFGLIEKNFSQVKIVLEGSSKDIGSVEDCIMRAQEYVVYPSAPLCKISQVHKELELKPKLVKAPEANERKST